MTFKKLRRIATHRKVLLALAIVFFFMASCALGVFLKARYDVLSKCRTFGGNWQWVQFDIVFSRKRIVMLPFLVEKHSNGQVEQKVLLWKINPIRVVDIDRKWFFNDDDLADIHNLTELARLEMYQCRISNSGLEYLIPLRKLKKLNLQGGDISDAGIEHLKKMTHLQELDLRATKVSKTGLEELQRSLPNCQIYK